MHLFHRLWSMTQSLGVPETLGIPETLGNVMAQRRAAAATAITIGVGYAFIPIAAPAGFHESAPAT